MNAAQTRRRRQQDLRLKHAILDDGRTQRRLAHLTNIGEVRFSAIVRGHGAPPTLNEMQKIVKVLGRPAEELFPPTQLLAVIEDAKSDDDAGEFTATEPLAAVEPKGVAR